MKISNNYELGQYFTFEPSKNQPIYNWFYYKEAYSPQFVEKILDKYFIQKKGNVLDPFSGVGTTCLVAKSRNLKAYGVDSSPLAVLAGSVKTRNYSNEEIITIRNFMKNIFQEKSAAKLNWKFELFEPKKAFPPANLRNILFIREKIALIENEKVRDFLLLALLSILPMCTFVLKDGGVLKIMKKKSVAPVQEMFKRKVKKMLATVNSIPGIEPEIYLGDARTLPFDDKSMDILITSPPYLNNIDYTKVYGLELSLLEMDGNSSKVARMRSIRSFITLDTRAEEIPQELEELGCKIPIVAAYFSDMKKVLCEIHRVLKPNSIAVFVVGNAVIHETHILVDEIVAEIGERIGFETEILVGSERFADIKHAKIKTRESAIIFSKVR